MFNLKFLENLRSKEEIINYFKQKGKEVTNEEIDLLKKRYNQVEENISALTLKQLDYVAGGVGCFEFLRKRLCGSIFKSSEDEFSLGKGFLLTIFVLSVYSGMAAAIVFSSLHDKK